MIATAVMEQASMVACGVSGYGKFAPRSGRLEPNAVAERWVRSARSECLDHLIVFSEANLRRVLSAYVAYYNRWRPPARWAKQLHAARLCLFGSKLVERSPRYLWSAGSTIFTGRCTTRFLRPHLFPFQTLARTDRVANDVPNIVS